MVVSFRCVQIHELVDGVYFDAASSLGMIVPIANVRLFLHFPIDSIVIKLTSSATLYAIPEISSFLDTPIAITLPYSSVILNGPLLKEDPVNFITIVFAIL